MGYKVDVGARNRQHLRNLPLSREGHIKVWAYVHLDIAHVSDAFRADPANRYPVGSRFFKMQLIFRDRNRFRLIEFVIDDSAAVYGVLKIESVTLY